MKDPYDILGVSKNASDDDIKKAYRELARKYHPDNYADSPLADLATEKMQEINDAYDAIMNSRKGSSGNGGGYSGGYSSNEFADIRELINNNHIDQAQELLDGVPLNKRTAEWYFLNGSVNYKRGWFDAAYTSFATACRMNPNSMEYRVAFNNMQRQRTNPYNPYRTAPTNVQCSSCDICHGLICADCCCECMGGDLIRCC